MIFAQSKGKRAQGDESRLAGFQKRREHSGARRLFLADWVFSKRCIHLDWPVWQIPCHIHFPRKSTRTTVSR